MKGTVDTDNKYSAGEIVYAEADPSTKLEVRRYTRKIYYCTIPQSPKSKDKVYFERELV